MAKKGLLLNICFCSFESLQTLQVDGFSWGRPQYWNQQAARKMVLEPLRGMLNKHKKHKKHKKPKMHKAVRRLLMLLRLLKLLMLKKNHQQ